MKKDPVKAATIKAGEIGFPLKIKQKGQVKSVNNMTDREKKYQDETMAIHSAAYKVRIII